MVRRLGKYLYKDCSRLAAVEVFLLLSFRDAPQPMRAMSAKAKPRLVFSDNPLPGKRREFCRQSEAKSRRVRRMSIWGKLAGAAAGLAVGGPIGALVGGLAGHLIVDRENDAPPDKQVAFTIGVIALGAKMAKVDGKVTKDEVRAFKEVFKVPDEEAHNVARVFDLAKQDVAGFESYAKQLAGLFKDDSVMLHNILEGLFHIAEADKSLGQPERDYLATVARH
jgi:uncharacterized tellurite resistance protein B-like protein